MNVVANTIARGIKKVIITCMNRFLDASVVFFPKNYETLTKRALSHLLITEYSGDEGQATEKKTGTLGYGLIHYAYIRNLKPKNVLCVGSRKGFIPALCALALKSNGSGHVDFVDPGYGPEDIGKNWSGIGFWKQQAARTHFHRLKLSGWITQHTMTSAEFAEQKKRVSYGYIYIDGDHSYQGVKRDYVLFWPKLTKGGLLVFHDIVANGTLDGGVFGVHKLWKELKKTHKKTIEFLSPKESGLGIIQK